MDSSQYALIKSREAWGRVIAKHYGIARTLTHQEVMDEVKNLHRKRKAGTLDDNQEYLAACLHI